MEKVSVIVPVYNVGLYVGQCLESICGQTFEQLEVVIVYDPSEDDSLSICHAWEKKDKRIRMLINGQRNGLGAARNLGLESATGKYIVYVDSDDWIAQDYIMSLYQAIEQSHADYASSTGFYEADCKSGSIQVVDLLPAGTYMDGKEKAAVLLSDAPAVWKKIYNREWLLKKHLRMPEFFCYEDWGYDIALVLQAEKIVQVPQKGVFYRTGSNGALSDAGIVSICRGFQKSIDFGLGQAGRAGLLPKYKAAILRYILNDYYERERMALAAQNKDALGILQQVKQEVLAGQFRYLDTDRYLKCICFGSFSLRWAVQEAFSSRYTMDYYGFSSLASAFSKGDGAEVYNKNEFRTVQVEKDITGAFADAVSSIDEDDGKTVLFLDFLEERNGLLQLGQGQYATNSEAYLDSIVGGVAVERAIASGSPEFFSLWKEKCRALAGKLSLKKGVADVVLVRSRLACVHGDFCHSVPFANAGQLKQANQAIYGLEQYFLKCCGQQGIPVTVVEVPEKYHVAGRHPKYGCSPQYMNRFYYAYASLVLFEKYYEGAIG